MKSKLQNCLVEHINNVIHIFFKDFFIKDTFLFQTIIANQNDNDEVKIGVNA